MYIRGNIHRNALNGLEQTTLHWDPVNKSIYFFRQKIPSIKVVKKITKAGTPEKTLGCQNQIGEIIYTFHVSLFEKLTRFHSGQF